MAIIHRAQLTPSKSELLRSFLASKDWIDEGGATDGGIEVLGAYRFDDPAGQVGVECHLVQTGESIFHLPLSYRDAPIEDAGEYLVGTLQHSVLGQRFVYDGLGDEVALDCFLRALCGEQQQALLDVYDGETLVEQPAPSVTLSLEVDDGAEVPSSERLLQDGEPFTIARTVGGLDGTVRLVADWGEDRGVVAAYSAEG